MPASPAASAKCATRMDPPATLEPVGETHADLGPRRAILADVLRATHHGAVGPVSGGEQREVVPIVKVGSAPRDLAHVDGRTPEAQIAALVREADQVVLDPFTILGEGGAYPNRGAVA